MGSYCECTFVLVSVYLFIFEVIEVCILFVAPYKSECCFTQIILLKSVSEFDELCVFGFKVTGLILNSGKACILGKLSVIFKMIDISNLIHDTGREYRAYSMVGYQNIW